MNSWVAGGFIAIVTALTIILSLEFGRSLLLIAAGFILFIIPFMFISSLKSTVKGALFIFFCIIIAYMVYRFAWYDIIFGIFLAFITGITIYHYRIKDVQTFSAADYKKMASDTRFNEKRN